jgi:D-cysteine desulfhydrase
MDAICRSFPKARERLPFVRLGTYPTPVERLAATERAAALPPGTELFVKRDDLSGEPWGTSKVRKLEHYFGEALACGARRVATVGPLGSNHALATAIYSRALGLEAHLFLWPEPPTAKVRETLLVEAAMGARLSLVGTLDERALGGVAEASRRSTIEGTESAIDDREAAGKEAGTYFIPPAGTDAVGAMGYVECGLEIAGAAARGNYPAPDFVFVAGGTGGVAAGLAVGLALAGLPARVVAVRAVAREVLSDARLVLLARRVHERLAGAADRPLPAPPPGRERFRILHAHAGAGYGRPTAEAASAAALLRETAGLDLDPVYTAKAAAGLLAFARGEGAGRRLLFLHTYGSRDLSAIAARARAEDLPEGIRRLFER